ncbi:MAG: protein kinase, partial [Actinomycetaceae bacterium]|nr:protein kinase [Actinomycetaceae bacterium]
MKNYAGKVFSDRYTLTRQIAVGAMGEVWAARDYLTYREIAIKVLRPELAGQKTFLQRLRVEARNAMQIEHPNLAGVLDHGEADGVGWIVMELVDGQPLNNYLAGGQRLTPQQLLPLLIQVAYALQAVNSHNVVHRDIKPSNIMITSEGIAKLTDFGISTTPDQETMTDAGMVMGTAQYLPPEQARGQEATHAGDLYALGVIAYEAAAGYRPFTGETQVDVAFAHVNEPVPELPDDVPDPLANIIYRLLRKNPAQRPADALELVRQLTAAASALQVSTNPQPLQLPAADTTATTPTASQPVVSEPAQTQEPARANESGEQDHPSSEESARASGQRDSVGIPHPRKSVQTAASRKSAVAPTRTSAPATSRKSAPANTRTAVPPKSTRTPAAASTGKSVPATSHNRART